MKIAQTSTNIAAVLSMVLWFCVLSERGLAKLPQDSSALELQIVDARTGNGISGARIDADYFLGLQTSSKAATSDARGICVLDPPLVSWTRVRILVTAEDHVPQSIIWERADIPVTHRIKLESGRTVGGMVLNEAGQPVLNAQVFLTVPSSQSVTNDSPDPFHFEKTDSSGRWICNHVPVRLNEVRFRLVHPDYASLTFTTGDTGESAPGIIKVAAAELQATNAIILLKPGILLSGIVRDVDRKPIEGAKILGGEYPVWTPVDGRFKIKNSLPGEFTFVCIAKGFLPELKRARITDGLEELSFQLTKASPLRIRVVDGKGLPVSGAAVGVENWKGQVVPDWQWMTDSEGRIVCDSVPAEGVTYSIRHPSFKPVESRVLTPALQEQVVTLQRKLRISGHVADIETKAPISPIRVIAGRFHDDHFHWERERTTVASNGNFAITLSGSGLPHAILIESDGYYPMASRPYKENEEEQNADFNLRKGTPLKGTVRLPDGKAAAGVEVALVSDSKGAILGAAKFVDHDRSNIVPTDGDGNFIFQPQLASRLVAVAHATGYAEYLMGQSKDLPVLTLRPWGRIEGVLLVGHEISTNQLVQVRRLGANFLALQANSFTALTDSKGCFVLEHLPPGSYLLGRLCESEFSHASVVEIKSGATSRVTLGGVGGGVKGRVTPDEPGRKLDWESWNHPAFIRRKISPLKIPEFKNSEAKRAWEWEYWSSEEGKERQKISVPYVLEFKGPEGDFAVQNVPVGDYELEVHYHEPPAKSGEPDHCLGILKKEITISEQHISNGDKKLDLGTFKIKLKKSGE